jgi:hypothetical protein
VGCRCEELLKLIDGCSIFAMVTSCAPCRWRHISARHLMVAGLATVMRSISALMGSWRWCKCRGLLGDVGTVYQVYVEVDWTRFYRRGLVMRKIVA